MTKINTLGGGAETRKLQILRKIVRPRPTEHVSLGEDLRRWRRVWCSRTGALIFGFIAFLVVIATGATWVVDSEYQMWANSPHYFMVMAKFFVVLLFVRILVRRRLPTVSQLLDMVLVLLLMTLLAAAYTSLKVQVPLINESNWDAEFAFADRILGVGMDLNVFLITVFNGGPPWLGDAIDTYYYAFVTMFVVFAAWFLTDPRQEYRVAFAAGWILIWGSGAILYVAFPSRGPVFFTRGLWQEIAAVFPFAAMLQSALLDNYTALVAGETRHIVHEYGVAAMPSLHVATHGYLWIWARRIGSHLAPVFLAMTMMTWLASVATGWHWAVDGLVGLVMAWGATAVVFQLQNLRESHQPSTPGNPS
jgi:hypothetical protein